MQRTRIIQVCLFFLWLFIPLHGLVAQKEKLKKRENDLKKEIQNTKALIEKTKKTQKLTMAELAIINQQIAYRDELIKNYSDQLNSIEFQIYKKKKNIETLKTELDLYKKRYIKLIKYAYKHRNKQNRLLFIFASSNFKQAFDRLKYIRNFTEYKQKQVRLIKQTQQKINTEIAQLSGKKLEKTELISQQASEKNQFENDKEQQKQTLNKLKADEKQLKIALQEKESKRREIEAKINQILAEEIRAEQRRKEAEEKKKADNKKKNNTSTNTQNNTNKVDKKENTTTADNKVNPTQSTPEVELASNEFEKNRGSLPWPVANGQITAFFGNKPHESVKGVIVKNNGIDITTTESATVRSVFKGKVSSIFIVPGAGKCVIVSHGVYRTVYTNLAEVFVTKGQEVTTKQSIGKLLPGDGETSECHFEIWKIIGEKMDNENPTNWIYK